MDDPPDVATLVAGLLSETDAARKYAVFKLQSALSDPSFADAFIHGDGLPALRRTVLQSNGNTQAYALGSVDALLDMDVGWEVADGGIIEKERIEVLERLEQVLTIKAVELAVAHPLVNIVRNALTLLVLVVSRPPSAAHPQSSSTFGFRAIKPALNLHPTFLEALVSRLSAADHTLCANSLQLINALMRDAIANGGQHEWPRFIKRLQDLSVIGGVGMLMRGDAASDTGSPLSAAILEFQGLTKVLLKKWKEVPLNVELSEHKKALKIVHLLSNPQDWKAELNGDADPKKRHHPEKWRRLGFETESPAWEFEETGYLGIMDLVDYARMNEDAYEKIFMEQNFQPREQRCPLARASMACTLILYEHFEIDQGADEGYRRSSVADRINGSMNVDHVFRPLLLQWASLHRASLNAFMRLWKASGAESDDFEKIEDLVRIVVERILSSSDRRTTVEVVEEQMRTVSLDTARQWQMDGLDEYYEEAWGPHLRQVREQLHHEALQFMKEQRIRCLLQGSWFPTVSKADLALQRDSSAAWRYVRLSHNRRYLHYAIFPAKTEAEVLLDDLGEKIDLNVVTSVVSNVSAPDPPSAPNNDSTEKLVRADRESETKPNTNTKISVYGMPYTQKPHSRHRHNYNHATDHAHNDDDHDDTETIMLELYPATSSLAAEWLDGLLMLLNQQPITKDTSRMMEIIEDWSLKIRMLNLRWEDADFEALERGQVEKGVGREVPSREGLEGEEGYWYDMGEG